MVILIHHISPTLVIRGDRVRGPMLLLGECLQLNIYLKKKDTNQQTFRPERNKGKIAANQPPQPPKRFFSNWKETSFS